MRDLWDRLAGSDDDFLVVPDDALTAAADVANGAMIALVPSDADAKRLAIEGGEPLDQLHLTLVYLGDADQIDPQTRADLINAGHDMVQGWHGVAGEAFAPALFNPTGLEPCAVLVCSGAELAEFYETAIADVTELVDLPDDMHLPFCAHITLAYLAPEGDPGTASTFEDLAAHAVVIDGAARVGPVLFDRLRFAFGGEVIDIPIETAQPPAPDLMDTGPAEATTAQAPAASASPGAEPAPAVVAAGDRVQLDICLRCFGPTHPGDCVYPAS